MEGSFKSKLMTVLSVPQRRPKKLDLINFISTIGLAEGAESTKYGCLTEPCTCGHHDDITDLLLLSILWNN